MSEAKVLEMTLMDPAAIYSTVDDRDVLQIIEAVRKGIKFAFFTKITNTCKFSLQEWANFLHLSMRTIQRYKKEKRTFDALQSEKIIEIALLNKLGVSIFGDQNRFSQWLETENIALGKRTPKNLMDSTFGIALLRDELSRIEHGILA